MTKDEKIDLIMNVVREYKPGMYYEVLAKKILDALEEPSKFRQAFRQNEMVWDKFEGLYIPFKLSTHPEKCEKLSPAILAATVADDAFTHYQVEKDGRLMLTYKTKDGYTFSYYVKTCPDGEPEEGEI